MVPGSSSEHAGHLEQSVEAIVLPQCHGKGQWLSFSCYEGNPGGVLL